MTSGHPTHRRLAVVSEQAPSSALAPFTSLEESLFSRRPERLDEEAAAFADLYGIRDFDRVA
ncbi:MAG: hypothetical protein AAGA54_05105 [Myxococcota bacterium]